ncbi:Rho GTPase-activating protein 1-like [Oopsacas minuta]|uniref:Rho GTPase-activating protein 1-like n=1 Tax=Oopsacas minuta TaxID=111878 RepID=A0AAV7KA00_9METZ|nr:Rho GTPase-activating protein 1-like [Oopsacas minuta]
MNLELLKYVLRILTKVIANEDTNKMSALNLSIVFGPNIIWSSTDSASLTTLNYINAFAFLLLTQPEDILPQD